LKSSQDDDGEYKLFSNYKLFEFDEIEKQWKMIPIAIHQLSGIDKVLNFESNIASNPWHVEEVITLQVNVNIQSSGCEEENNKGEIIYLPDKIIIPLELLKCVKELLGYDTWYVE